MPQKLYVGGLSYTTTEETIHSLFEKHGEVHNTTVIKDRYSGQSKGFAFVEMESGSDATRAIEVLNGSELDGRKITVSEARERTGRGNTENRRW